MFNVLFSFRGYEVTFLELIASLASFIGVGLGITGKRITWPWWAISSTLYAILFWKWDLYAVCRPGAAGCWAKASGPPATAKRNELS